MSYVDAFHNRDTDTIHVVERVDGKREFKEYPGKYTTTKIHVANLQVFLVRN